MTVSFLVSVPATSANLGPGFDCLGLALDLWNQAEFSIRRFSDSSDSNDSARPGDTLGISLEIEGCGAKILPRDETNLIVKAARALSARVQIPLPAGINIRCRNGFPPGSGLGSSSSAILLGLVGANTLLNQPLSPAELLTFASEMEGHPDNVTPALLGGLTVSTVHEGQVIARKFSVAPVSLAVVIPAFELSTHAARAALPKQIPLADAVYNLGRVPLVVEALRSGDLALLAQVMEDRLHQPYRLPLYPGAQAAFEAARGAGASAVAISGAGPGVIAFSENEFISQQTATAMSQAFCEARLEVWVCVTRVAEEGTRVESGTG
ncbi:MAG TPA: homoserine kinase [Anaerolineales bacterium]|nr:homoserine kinase [Anaerolineales bacterium]